MFLLIWVRRWKSRTIFWISIHLMFLLIRVCFGGRKWHTISIHLMFLLIALPPSPGCPLVHFNTSHVSINRLMRIDQNGPNYHFNTSHVSINPQRIMSLTYSIRISIHLMFLLIGKHSGCIDSGSSNFNTSHVSINLACTSHMYLQMVHFNTSHVSINQEERTVCPAATCISIHLMFLLITERCGGFAGRSRISIHLMFLLI